MVGENGTGKTTIVRMLAGKLTLDEGGTVKATKIGKPKSLMLNGSFMKVKSIKKTFFCLLRVVILHRF